jgi:uncharacterized protein
MTPDRPSEERLNALVDNELTPADAAEVLERLSADASLRDEVCRMRLGKDLVRHAYADIEPPPAPPARARAPRPWRLAAAAAVFGIGLFLGWMARDGIVGPGEPPLPLARAPAAPLEAGHVILHIGSAAPEKALAALEHAAGLIEAARASGQPLELEIVANGPGLDLLRAAVSPHGPRLASLHAASPGLTLVACGQTVHKLRAEGAEVQLLPGTVIATSALDQIVMRMQQGWAYVRI